MTRYEEVLLFVLEQATDPNEMAVMLQSFIAENGPLSEDAGARVRSLLETRALMEPH
jgi:hypothetical protein